MIRIKHLTCPVCEGNMESTSFSIDSNLSDSHRTIFKITYKCDRCNTFTTTYSSMNKGGLITHD